MFSKGQYLTLFDRIALTIIVTSVVMTVVFQIMSIHQKSGTSSPIPNTTMDSDGESRLNPKNGCGPFAHVENHPEYGLLCIQDEGSWKVTTDDSEAKKSVPCASASVSGTAASNGLVLSCQSDSTWQERR